VGLVRPWGPTPEHPAPASRSGLDSYVSKVAPLGGPGAWEFLGRDKEYKIPWLRNRSPTCERIGINLITEFYVIYGYKHHQHKDRYRR
jgi:hypothetical protein